MVIIELFSLDHLRRGDGLGSRHYIVAISEMAGYRFTQGFHRLDGAHIYFIRLPEPKIITRADLDIIHADKHLFIPPERAWMYVSTGQRPAVYLGCIEDQKVKHRPEVVDALKAIL